VVGAAARTCRAALARHRPALQGKRIFFFPDSQLEVPLARFLSRELGMQLAEVGTPYLHRSCWPGAALLPAGTQLVRRPGRGAPARPLPRRAPDLVVCGLGLANPLEAEGTPPSGRSSWFSRLIQGFEQATDLADLAALFGAPGG
jgi:light-independent protochlorophyllide reductase subunit N